MGEIVSYRVGQCLCDDSLVPIFLADPVAYLGVETLYVRAPHEADIAYRLAMNRDAEIGYLCFLLCLVDEDAGIPFGIGIGQPIAAVVPDFLIIKMEGEGFRILKFPAFERVTIFGNYYHGFMGVMDVPGNNINGRISARRA